VDPRKMFADQRLTGFCVYCGGPGETRDHVPSKALLDQPYPSDLPVVEACAKCNNAFALDEEYVACFLECTIIGSTIPHLQSRPSIRRKLTEAPALQALIEASRIPVADGTLVWQPDEPRVEAVLVKLARGHMAFEEGTPRLEEPGLVDCVPLSMLSPDESQELVGPWPSFTGWPELGSRAFLRAAGARVPHNPQEDGWIVIQPNRYRYRVQVHTVQMVLSDYLACTVIWQ
jgi:hypothetical protein